MIFHPWLPWPLTEVATAMTNFNEEQYKEHKTSIRKLIIFGETCEICHTKPTERIIHMWMPKYIALCRARKYTIIQDKKMWKKAQNLDMQTPTHVWLSDKGNTGNQKLT